MFFFQHPPGQLFDKVTYSNHEWLDSTTMHRLHKLAARVDGVTRAEIWQLGCGVTVYIKGARGCRAHWRIRERVREALIDAIPGWCRLEMKP